MDICEHCHACWQFIPVVCCTTRSTRVPIVPSGLNPSSSWEPLELKTAQEMMMLDCALDDAMHYFQLPQDNRRVKHSPSQPSTNAQVVSPSTNWTLSMLPADTLCRSSRSLSTSSSGFRFGMCLVGMAARMLHDSWTTLGTRQILNEHGSCAIGPLTGIQLTSQKTCLRIS